MNVNHLKKSRREKTKASSLPCVHFILANNVYFTNDFNFKNSYLEAHLANSNNRWAILMMGSYFWTGKESALWYNFVSTPAICAFVGRNLMWPMDCLREFDWVGGAPPVETNSPIGRLWTNPCAAESWGYRYFSTHPDWRLAVLGMTACLCSRN